MRHLTSVAVAVVRCAGQLRARRCGCTSSVRTVQELQAGPAGGGNLHALMNPTDRRASLFTFGGYD